MASWYKVKAFVEEEADALRNAYTKAQRAERDDDAEGSQNYIVTQSEQERKEEEEILNVVDNALTKRVIEIYNTSITIQNLVLSKDMKRLDDIYLTKEEGDMILEKVIMRPKNVIRAIASRGKFA